MPLVKCPDCGNDVSSEAQACVRCGRPIAGHPPFDGKRAEGHGAAHNAAAGEKPDGGADGTAGNGPAEGGGEAGTAISAGGPGTEAPPAPAKDPYKLPFFHSAILALLAALYAVSPWDLIPDAPYVCMLDDAILLVVAVINLLHSCIGDSEEDIPRNKTMRRVKMIAALVGAATIVIVAVTLRIAMILLRK